MIKMRTERFHQNNLLNILLEQILLWLLGRVSNRAFDKVSQLARKFVPKAIRSIRRDILFNPYVALEIWLPPLMQFAMLTRDEELIRKTTEFWFKFLFYTIFAEGLALMLSQAAKEKRARQTRS